MIPGSISNFWHDSLKMQRGLESEKINTQRYHFGECRIITPLLLPIRCPDPPAEGLPAIAGSKSDGVKNNTLKYPRPSIHSKAQLEPSGNWEERCLAPQWTVLHWPKWTEDSVPRHTTAVEGNMEAEQVGAEMNVAQLVGSVAAPPSPSAADIYVSVPRCDLALGFSCNYRDSARS